MPINLSETATKEIKSIIDSQELDGETVKLRVGVKGGGCSGFSYLLDLTETQRDNDEEFEVEGLRVVCDPELPLPQWHQHRLQRRGHGPRLRVQQPECDSTVGVGAASALILRRCCRLVLEETGVTVAVQAGD